jgi:hypothetical protein
MHMNIFVSVQKRLNYTILMGKVKRILH